jgi:hypothetical protein
MAGVQRARFRNRRRRILPGRTSSYLGFREIEIEGKRYDFDVVIERSHVRRRWDRPLAVAPDFPVTRSKRRGRSGQIEHAFWRARQELNARMP